MTSRIKDKNKLQLGIRLKIIVQTDRQTEWISECRYSERPFELYTTRPPKRKISQQRGNQYTSLIQNNVKIEIETCSI